MDNEDVPLIDPTQNTRDLAIQIAWVVSEHFPDIVDYKYPLDMSSEASVNNVKAELGPAAVMPTDTNGYYLFMYITDRARNRVPVLLPVDEVRTAMFALAVREDAVWARTVAFYSWLLP